MSPDQINIPTEEQNSPKSSPFSNDTLSVIIRCHKPQRIDFLDEALFSLAIQYWRDLEIIVVLQNGADEFKEAVINLIKRQPFSNQFKFQIHSNANFIFPIFHLAYQTFLKIDV